MDDRITLAYEMGLITDIEMPSTKGKAPFRIVYPDGGGQICDSPLDFLPDPFTDANDCEALIQHLNSLGWQVEIHWQHTSDENLAAGSWVHIWQHGTEIHHRADIDVDRWKLLVCNIALAIFTSAGGDPVRAEQITER